MIESVHLPLRANALALVALSLVGVLPAPAHGQDRAAEGLAPGLFEKVKQATVEVLIDDHQKGSGWFVDSQGWAFTAAHMIDTPSSRVEVFWPGASRHSAKVVAVDLGHDLALMQVEPRQGGYPALPLAKTLPAPGDDVFVLGAPMFRHSVLLRGMMACQQPVFEFYGNRHVEVVHIAATVQGGMSGAAWFNRRGEVVGQQSAVLSMNSIPVGIANVVPVQAIAALWNSKKSASTPNMGAAVEETWQQDRAFLGRFPPKTEGLVVKALENDRPAQRAGLKQWDVITAADGQKVRLTDQLVRIVRQKQPGQPIKLAVLGPDGTGTREVTVILGKMEVGWP